jgi:hypothetical protein
VAVGYSQSVCGGDQPSHRGGVRPEGVGGSAAVNPALGLAWSYCVNTRIILSRDTTSLRCIKRPVVASFSGSVVDDTTLDDGDDDTFQAGIYGQEGNVAQLTTSTTTAAAPIPAAVNVSRSSRVLTVEFSPCIPRNSCPYDVTADGVVGLSY